MANILAAYFIGSAIEYFYYMKKYAKIDRDASSIPMGDLEYYQFHYPSDAVLRFFVPAYVLVKIRAKMVNFSR